MKDGSTHLAHKAEHAVDLGEGGHGAILAVNVCDAAAGDTATVADTLVQATENLAAVKADPLVADKVGDDYVTEGVFDKGYHSRQTLLDLAEMGARSYVSEPDRGRQDWDGQAEAKAAVYANRRRVNGDRGKRLLRSRGEKLERSFAHCYETGGLRRLHLRGRENVAKRVLVHAAAFNLGLVMRLKYGLAKPRSLSAKAAAAAAALCALVVAVVGRLRLTRAGTRAIGTPIRAATSLRRLVGRPGSAQIAA
jgi:transposase